jgi:hypothetical protein
MGGTGMMPSLALAAAAIFAIVLLLLRSKEEEPTERLGVEFHDRCHPHGTLQATELARRIFSREDEEFVERMESRRIQRLYVKERRRVALHWIRRTSDEVSGIMRRHRLASRQSADLNVVAETKLFWQFVELRVLCGTLFMLVHIFGPQAAANLAAHAGALYQQIGRSLPNVTGTSQVAISGSVVRS